MNATLIPAIIATIPANSEFAIEVSTKAAALCIAVWVAHLMAGRNRVLFRSALWHGCLVGLAVLPLAVATLPHFHVTTARDLQPRMNADPHDLPATMDASTTSVVAASVESPLERAMTDSSAGSMVKKVELTQTATPNHFGETSVLAVFAIYFAMLVILLVRLVASLVAVAALRHKGSPVINPEWHQAKDRWQSQFAQSKPIQLLQSDSVSVPVVVGGKYPAILLPTGLAQTDDEQTINAVLLHEMTHIARGDYAWNLLLRIVRAIYWPHPGIWVVDHMIRNLREEVCDGVCVYWLNDVRTYCAILVDVATSVSRRPDVVLGMAMSNSSRLGRRLARVETGPRLNCGSLNGLAQTTLAAFILGVVCVLGSLQPEKKAFATEDVSTSDDTSKVASEQIPPPVEPAKATVQGVTDDSQAFGHDPAPQNLKTSKPALSSTVKVTKGKFERAMVFPTQLILSDLTSVHARNAGVICKVNVELGDQVQAQQVLAELDDPGLEAELADKESALAQVEADEERAKAVVAAAQATVQVYLAELVQVTAELDRAAAIEKLYSAEYSRVKTLVESKAVDAQILQEIEQKLHSAHADVRSSLAKIDQSKAEVERRKRELILDEASLKIVGLRVAGARASLDRTRAKSTVAYRQILSPINGIIVDRNINLHEYIKPADNQSLFRIAAAGSIKAAVQLPEEILSQVKRGDRVTVEFTNLEKGQIVTGTISRLAYIIDVTTRTLLAEITLPNASGKLRPGMSGRAKINVGEFADVLSVPVSALSTRRRMANEAICARVVNGQPMQTSVTVGESNGDRIVILEGLSEGNEIFADFHNLQPQNDPKNPTPDDLQRR